MPVQIAQSICAWYRDLSWNRRELPAATPSINNVSPTCCKYSLPKSLSIDLSLETLYAICARVLIGLIFCRPSPGSHSSCGLTVVKVMSCSEDNIPRHRHPPASPGSYILCLLL